MATEAGELGGSARQRARAWRETALGTGVGRSPQLPRSPLQHPLHPGCPPAATGSTGAGWALSAALQMCPLCVDVHTCAEVHLCARVLLAQLPPAHCRPLGLGSQRGPEPAEGRPRHWELGRGCRRRLLLCHVFTNQVGVTAGARGPSQAVIVALATREP